MTPELHEARARAGRRGGLAGARHGHARRGQRSPEFNAWHAMVQRCTNHNNPRFPRYGGRGIQVCQRWRDSFDAFFADMGLRPSPEHSIERKDNNRGYDRDNCIWALREAQMRNTVRTHFIEANGERLCITDWAARLGVRKSVIHGRLARGWSPARAVMTPSKKGN